MSTPPESCPSRSRRGKRGSWSRYANWDVHRIEPADIISVSELEKRDRQSFWGALVIVSALRVGATTLLTEDIQHGRRIAGTMIFDPFREG